MPHAETLPPAWDVPLDRLPLHQQALHVEQLFKSARSTTELLAASERWSRVRPRLVGQEKGWQCEDSGAASEREIVLSLVEDLVKAPIGLTLSAFELLLAVTSQDADGAGEALQSVLKDIADKAVGAVRDKSAKRVSDVLQPHAERLREALLKYLQSKSTRSRQHFLRMIEACSGAVVSALSVGTLLVSSMLKPIRITPEWCGLRAEVDRAQAEAMQRLIPTSPGGRILAPASPQMPALQMPALQ